MRPLPPPERYRRIEPIVARALELTADERAAYLDQACAEDAELRADVEALIAADAEAGSFLSAAARWEPSEQDGVEPALPAGASIGPYRVLREIGRGGMGVVYEAEQQRPRRSVALKVILGARHVDADTVRMFQRESASLARLKHPGIAAIHESGSTEDGLHYFAMELVQGRTLSRVLDEAGAPASRPALRLRLALFRKICAAVAYAHQRGVIHRDLKPSNILVVDADAPEIKVLDFGLARITDPDGAGESAFTALGRIQGTLPYMSPEQVRGRRDEVDVRTDVYALGVILYRMLSGRLPFELEQADLPQAARIVSEQEPRPVRAAGAGVKLEHDLTVIVHKAIDKDPARRYASVAALEDDVARYLGGQPILARGPSPAYQLRKLVARHKAAFGVAGVVALLLVAFAVASAMQARRIAAERDRANREAVTAREVSDFMTDLFKVSDPSAARGNSITAREILDQGVARIEQELAGQPEVRSRLMMTMGTVYSSLGLYDRAAPLLEQTVETRRGLLGAEHPDTLAAMHALASTYELTGRSAEAEALYDRVIEARRRLLGEEHPDVLLSLSSLARVYRPQGRYPEAEELDRRLLETRRRLLGEDHADTITSMFALAADLYLERRYAEAEALFRPALERARVVLGEDHPTTVANTGYLAVTLSALDRHDEAEQLLRGALERLRGILGDEHPYTLEMQSQVAVVLDGEGRYADAERIWRETLEKRRRVLGPDHQMTLSNMNNLANMLFVQGRYAEAEPLLRETLERQRRLLGEDHPHTVNTLYNLACLSALAGDRRAALGWLDQAVAHGWAHADHLAEDQDLKSLHGDPAFDTIVARARSNGT